MLSFFRTKSSEGTVVDKIINATKNLSVEVAEVAEVATSQNIQTMQQSTTPTATATATATTVNNQTNDPYALLKSLGYNNDIELKETIYGKSKKRKTKQNKTINQDIDDI